MVVLITLVLVDTGGYNKRRLIIKQALGQFNSIFVGNTGGVFAYSEAKQTHALFILHYGSTQFYTEQQASQSSSHSGPGGVQPVTCSSTSNSLLLLLLPRIMHIHQTLSSKVIHLEKENRRWSTSINDFIIIYLWNRVQF